ncbi:hypothetical protein C942_04925 [Photobacterium marinum]|uniref:Uncharacterized protein n=1 Tax=Photobacterium marinum TaxID=1056511 RepID=L8JDD7_9GAMM|nr:hypothetical protein C942_04925 [Photobacterium marinum]
MLVFNVLGSVLLVKRLRRFVTGQYLKVHTMIGILVVG